MSRIARRAHPPRHTLQGTQVRLGESRALVPRVHDESAHTTHTPQQRAHSPVSFVELAALVVA
eukprot:276945-Pleurochrysis_carterae.AAC.1